jgi:hypothetical protein
MAEDPFETFRRAVAGMGTGGFDPTTFGAMGWPMTPWPTGEGVGPAASTKQALRQLFRAIETLGEGDVPGPAEGFDPGRFGVDTAREFVDTLLGTYSLWFQGLSQLLVESYTVRLLYETLVVDGERTVDSQAWLWGLAQADREQLLRRCTDTDATLVSEMSAARERRNELLFRFGEFDGPETAVADARRYLAVLSELDGLVNEDGFRFRPED